MFPEFISISILAHTDIYPRLFSHLFVLQHHREAPGPGLICFDEARELIGPAAIQAERDSMLPEELNRPVFDCHNPKSHQASVVFLNVLGGEADLTGDFLEEKLLEWLNWGCRAGWLFVAYLYTSSVKLQVWLVERL